MKRRLVLIMLCCVYTGSLHARTAWEMCRHKDGIKIFTSRLDNCSFKSVRVECLLNAKPEQLLALLLDIDHNDDWVYNIRSSKLLKSWSDHEMVYYAEIATPWPFTNRDLIAHLKAERESEKVIIIRSQAQPDFIPVNKNLVRIKSSSALWTITALNDQQIKVEYELQFNPGGSVPPWLINMFVSDGPYETFKKLKERVNLPAYQNAHFNL